MPGEEAPGLSVDAFLLRCWISVLKPGREWRGGGEGGRRGCATTTRSPSLPAQLLGHLLVVASQTAKAEGLSEGYRVGE